MVSIRTMISRKRVRLVSLRSKIILYFVLFFITVITLLILVDLFGIPYANIEGEFQVHKYAFFENLSLVADLKKVRLQEWLEERKNDLKVISESVLLKSGIREIQRSVQKYKQQGWEKEQIRSYMQENKDFQDVFQHLSLVKNAYGIYERIHIVDSGTNTVLGSSDIDEVGMDVSYWDLIEPNYSFRDVFVTTVKDEAHGGVALVITRSMKIDDSFRSGRDESSLIVTAYIDFRTFIEPMLSTGGGLGETGEALLVNQKTQVLNHLKHPLADGSAAEPLEFRINAEPAYLAATGRGGIVMAEDYRHVPVLAAYRYIPLDMESGWGLIIKKDKSEVFAPIYRRISIRIMASLLAGLVVVVLVWFFAIGLTKPLQALRQTVQSVEKGNFGAQVPISDRTEIGQLARTFNAMTTQLHLWHKELEAKVQARTAELISTNRALKRQIKQRKNAEESLQKSYDLLHTIIESTQDVVYVKDLQGRYVEVNSVLLNAFGKSREEVIGSDDAAFLPPEIAESIRAVDLEVMKTGAAETYEEKTEVDGEEKYWLSNIVPYRDPIGNIIGIIGISKDINERKQSEKQTREFSDVLKARVDERTLELEEQTQKIGQTQQALSFLMEDVNEYRSDLINANAELKESNQELESFSYSVSHDLRAPLRAIDGFSLKLKNNYYDVLDQEGRRLINIVRDSTEHMARLIDDLLALSRTGKVPLRPQEFDMIRLCKDVWQELAGLSPDRTIKIKIASLPPAVGDRNLIKQVLINLVSNAIKFTEYESSAMIKIGCTSQKNKNIYYVKDNGVGFDMKYVGKLFQVFQRLHSEKDFAGTGVGLAIVHRIIHRHGGKVWAEAEVGKGATFYFSL